MRRVVIPLLAGCLLMGGVPEASAAEASRDLPQEFRKIGTYKLSKRVKVRDGEVFPVAINEVIYEVYTDGISVRCYAGEGDAFTSFEIYRRDGITVSRSRGLVETVPGIQAKTFVGDVFRQLSLTEEKLTLSKFPALSDIVEITYAERT
jgi:hypothetical protein